MFDVNIVSLALISPFSFLFLNPILPATTGEFLGWSDEQTWKEIYRQSDLFRAEETDRLRYITGAWSLPEKKDLPQVHECLKVYLVFWSNSY